MKNTTGYSWLQTAITPSLLCKDIVVNLENSIQDNHSVQAKKSGTFGH
jgi:hypothetical protein